MERGAGSQAVLLLAPRSLLPAHPASPPPAAPGPPARQTPPPRCTGEKRGQSPFVRSTRRAVPANGDCPLFPTHLDPFFDPQQVRRGEQARTIAGRRKRSRDHRRGRALAFGARHVDHRQVFFGRAKFRQQPPHALQAHAGLIVGHVPPAFVIFAAVEEFTRSGAKRGIRVHLFIVVRIDAKADSSPRFRLRWRHQLPNGVEHNLELCIVLVFQRVEFAGKFRVGG